MAFRFENNANLTDVNNRVVTDVVDGDRNGVADDADNCTNDANALQQDNDGDGIGNLCDADFNNDCAVNFGDLGIMKANFLHAGDLVTDMTNDNATNFGDLGLLKGDFLRPPAPSGVPNLCSGRHRSGPR